MKKASNILLSVAFLLVMTAGIANAHCGFCEFSKKEENDGYVQKKVEKMTTELGLSVEQAAQVESLIKEKVEKKKAIVQEKNDAIKAVKEEFSAKINALLNDEQKAKYEVMKAESDKGSDHENKDSDHDHK